MKKRFVWYEDLDGIICCPNCHTNLDVFYRDIGIFEQPERFEPKFCPDCGQALDWSEKVLYGENEKH